jgi:hypothetical protein
MVELWASNCLAYVPIFWCKWWVFPEESAFPHVPSVMLWAAVALSPSQKWTRSSGLPAGAQHPFCRSNFCWNVRSFLFRLKPVGSKRNCEQRADLKIKQCWFSGEKNYDLLSDPIVWFLDIDILVCVCVCVCVCERERERERERNIQFWFLLKI